MSSNSNFSNEDSFISQDDKYQDNANVLDVMRKRQTSFFELIRKTADSIIGEEVPLLLCRLLACFDDKLTELLQGKN